MKTIKKEFSVLFLNGGGREIYLCYANFAYLRCGRLRAGTVLYWRGTKKKKRVEFIVQTILNGGGRTDIYLCYANFEYVRCVELARWYCTGVGGWKKVRVL